MHIVNFICAYMNICEMLYLALGIGLRFMEHTTFEHAIITETGIQKLNYVEKIQFLTSSK